MSVVMYATGDSVVAGLVPATSRRCCGRVSICNEIRVIRVRNLLRLR